VAELVCGSGCSGFSDGRVPARLASHDGCWLAPLVQTMTLDERRALAADEDRAPKIFSTNSVFVMLDRPVTLSCIRLVNYSKTPARGVRDLKIDLDGRLLFLGSARPNPNGLGEGLVVVFSRQQSVCLRAKPHVHYCGEHVQDVLHFKSMIVVLQSRASTCTTGQQRPLRA
jgi:hypothetical protein